MDDESADVELPADVISPDAPCDVCHDRPWIRRVSIIDDDDEGRALYLCATCPPS